MNVTKKATSVIEAMVIMLIIVTGVVGMYNIYIESIRLSDLTAQRLQAIQVAREGIEAVENIRNTNWILYAADYENCWNTFQYDNSCIGIDPADSTTTDIAPGSYTIFQNNDLRWTLSGVVDTSNNFSEYIDLYEVGTLNNFYTQTGSFESLAPKFTREIQISYLDITGIPGDSDNPNMEITSLVQWVGRSDVPHKVELDLILSNWKDKE